MFVPKSFHTSIALDTLLYYFRTGKHYTLPDDDLPDSFLKPGACFVSILDKENKMKACMGTIEATTKNLFSEIVQNTLHAAFEDLRTTKLSEDELEDINLTVETVEAPEEITSIRELDPANFGVIIISKKNKKMGVLLPNCEGVDTSEKQVSAALRKGGINASIEEAFKEMEMFRFKIDKHL